MALALGASFDCSAQAQPWVPRYEAPPGTNGSQLGSSIAVRTVLDVGRVAVRVYVGAPYEDNGGLSQAGAVHIYNPDPQGWQLVSTLYSNTPQAGAHFGATLAQGYDNLVVGAPDFVSGGGSNPGAGRIEFYNDNGQPPGALTWLAAISGGTDQHLGRSLAMDRDMAAVGFKASNDRGCVSTYRYYVALPHWRNFPAIDNTLCDTPGTDLGSSLAIRRTGDDAFVMVAGAPGESQNGNALAGAAHVYVPNPNVGTGGLIEIGTLAAPNPQFLDVFGTSVGVDANYVYVGATGRDNGVGRVGSVTIFEPALVLGYNLLDEYFPGAPATIGGHCGASLAVDQFNDQFIVGCPDSTGTIAQEGNARIFAKTLFLGQPVWFESRIGFGNLAHGADHLGTSVAVTGNQAFVGAPKTDSRPPDAANGSWWEFSSDDTIFEDGFE
jgi:hypothetical protein